MAVASSGTKIVPEFSNKLEGALSLTITPEDCEEGGYGASSKEGHSQSLCDLFSSPKATGATKENGIHSVDLNSDSSSSSTSSHKGKLPTVLEESESLSHRDSSSIWDTSSFSSIASSSTATSSTHAFLRKGTSTDKAWPSGKLKKPWKPHKKTDGKKESIVSLLLWPLKKVRDAYMSCMMGLDGAGDLSGIAQGSTFATSSKYFNDLPLSKTDVSNHG